MSSSSVAICTICLQDTRPFVEDLQSISACGHIFHELCLQKWMELCPAGGHPTCPVCKRSISCRAHGIHRLNFQSAESYFTGPQVSPSRNLEKAVEDPNHVNCSSGVCQLKSKLDAAMKSSTVRNCIIEQFKALESQVAVNLGRVEEAGAANVVARTDLDWWRGFIQEEVREAVLKQMEKVLSSYEQARWNWFSWVIRALRANPLSRIHPMLLFLAFVLFMLVLVIVKMLADV